MKYLSLFSGIGGFEYGIQKAYSQFPTKEPKQTNCKKRGECPVDKQGISLHSQHRDTPLCIGCNLPEPTSTGLREGKPHPEGKLREPECHQPQCVGFSEIDKYAKSIYQHHFPNHPDLGDATQINPDKLPDFDLLVAGFPCQAFSIAGKGRGFCDPRGTLFFEILRILEAKKPETLLLENVRGLLSNDKGRTFQTIIRLLTNIGYDLQWQVLNTKDFGVPQNRERVFIVGHLGGRSRRQVFPIIGADGEINRLNQIGLLGKDSEATRVYSPTGLSRTIKNGGGMGAKTGLYAFPTTKNGDSYCLDSNYFKGANELNKGRRTQVVSLNRKEGIKKKIKLAHSLNSGDWRGLNRNQSQNAVCIDDYNHKYRDDELCGTVRQTFANSAPGNGCKLAVGNSTESPQIVVPVLTPDREKKRQNGRRFKEDGDPSFTLTGQDRHGILSSPPIRIRRLTPTECERLQGFPDGWTTKGTTNNELVDISDTQRYKCLGNAVTTNVIENIIIKLFFGA